MTEPTYLPKPVADQQVPVAHPVGAKSPADAWLGVEAILAGKGAAADLVGLARQLDDAHRDTLRTKLVDVAQVTTGDTVIDLGELLEVPYKPLLEAAFAAKRGEPTVAHLQRYLAMATTADLMDLDTGVAEHLAKRMAGQPMLVVMPRSGANISALEKQPALLKWFVDSTSPGAVAQVMGLVNTQEFGKVIDKLGLWKKWIGHVHVALFGYSLLAESATDPDIKLRLLAPFGSNKNTVDESDAIDQAVMTGASKERLLSAIGTAGSFGPEKNTEVITALRRVRATADEVLQITAISLEPGIAWLQLLFDSAGVTPSHIMAFIGQNKVPPAEFTPAILRQLRARLGKALHIYQLFPKSSTAHTVIVESEALRQWFLEDATPTDLLWFSASDPGLATKATRGVVASHPDWAWVRKLTGAENHVHLRTLALACNDAATRKFIREELVHDLKGVAKFEHGELSAKAYGGELDRLRFAIELGDPHEVLDRIADLDEAERRMFGSDPKTVANLFDKVSVNAVEFARAAHLLDLSFTLSLTHCPRGTPILSHLRTRSVPEEAAALGHDALVERAARQITPDLLVVFPSLATRAVLAKALASTPSLLQMLLQGSDPLRVVELISAEPVATPALEVLADERAVVRLLPARDQLSAAGRGLLDRLAATPHVGAKTAETIEHVKTDSDVEDRTQYAETDEERVAVARAATIYSVQQVAMLPAAIDQLLTSDLKRDPGALAAVLSAHRAEVPALLDESSQWPRVAELAKRLDLAPAQACPFIAVELLLQLSNALRWYFELDDPTALLHLVSRPGVANVVGQNLGANTPGARTWLTRLPRGAALTADERRLIDLLERGTQNGEVLRDLFQTRFDVQPPPLYTPGEEGQPARPTGAGYDAGQLDSLYRVMSRLPASQVDQKRIQRIASEVTPSAPGAAGSWDGSNVRIGPDQHEGADKSSFHPDALDEKTPEQGWLTTEEVKHAFGYDDAAIAAHVKAKNLVSKDVDGLTVYKMKPVEIDSFTQVVLHEIGHSVDDMLGGSTSPVFQYAGWHEFNDNQFDAWAGEMGGWDKVTTPDKAKIRQAWIDAARENVGVHQLVGRDHPAMADSYAEVGIVKCGREQRSFSAWNRDIINGRMFVAGSYPGRWFSVDAAIVPSAPSYYSLYAPAEYFAESYVEYYRGVDGSPGSEKKKGGGLATPVKKFFDQKVDTLKYDPRRFEGKEEV